jgi:hypothetical protein
MPDENPTRDPAGEQYATATWMAERAITLQLIRDDHDARWTLAELEREVPDVPGGAVRGALGRLRDEGVAVACGAHVLASRCARRLDDLGLIGV